MNRVVTLPNYGKVKCCMVTKASESTARPVLKFIGIPFARPPVGKLRFMPPKKLVVMFTDWFYNFLQLFV